MTEFDTLITKVTEFQAALERLRPAVQAVESLPLASSSCDPMQEELLKVAPTFLDLREFLRFALPLTLDDAEGALWSRLHLSRMAERQERENAERMAQAEARRREAEVAEEREVSKLAERLQRLGLLGGE